ncbi:sigma-70 family RNA polymerase sigma factor [Kribbella sp. CA-293567]|uniref:sigma-70 family RNA polymerase sigma factor n=1 Tax=Kribbella sp. CA-293567 TaxID=3002436 RepID=UPI0022DDFC7C|nr:sigma-70 family RNA polymerase sigma factor [Kribbella sp. CA-293567]WBQ03629.1 sigma-70 family RNA polymerase sigma factor [Kribbella sp. CA-293567]
MAEESLTAPAESTALTPPPEDDRPGLDAAVAIFLSVRPRLVRIAGRVLAGSSDAEDVVQEVWSRWQRTDRSVIANPQAFLVTVTVRLAINAGHSAQRRHETPVDEWFQDHLGCPDDDPAIEAERGDEVERAVLVLLGSLPARERAAYVLREAFDYPYGRISEMLHLRAANTRQLVCRARGHLTAGPSTPVAALAHRQFVEAFLKAARSGDLTDLEEVLTADLACGAPCRPS